MVRDGKGIHKAVRGLDGVPQKVVKTVLIHAFSGNRAAEAAQAATVEGELTQIHHPAFTGQRSAKIRDHISQIFVIFSAVGHDDHIPAAVLVHLGQHRLVNRFLPGRGLHRRHYKGPMLTGKHQLVKEVPGILLTLFGEQILHIGRKSANHLHAQITAVFLHIAVGGHVVKMLGGGNLTGEFAGQVHPVRLDQLDQPVKLIGRDEGVDRVAEQHQLGLLQGSSHRRKILFICLDSLAHRQKGKFMLRMQRLQIERCVNSGGVLPLGTCVQNQYLHACSSNSRSSRAYQSRSKRAAAMP